MHSPPVQPTSSSKSGTGSVITMWEEVTVRRELSPSTARVRGPTASTAADARTEPPSSVRATTPPRSPPTPDTRERSKIRTPRSSSFARSPSASRAGWSVAKSGTNTPRRKTGESQRARTCASVSSWTASGAPSSAAARTELRPASSKAAAVETQM